jgi:hypothetical protein
MDNDFLLCGFTRAIFGEKMSGGVTVLSLCDQASWMVRIAKCRNGKSVERE